MSEVVVKLALKGAQVRWSVVLACALLLMQLELQEYVKRIEGPRSKQSVVRVLKDKEPLEFVCAFHGWSGNLHRSKVGATKFFFALFVNSHLPCPLQDLSRPIAFLGHVKDFLPSPSRDVSVIVEESSSDSGDAEEV